MKARNRNGQLPADTPRHEKLPKLPSGVAAKKRPLLHPPISSPASSSSTQKIIYVSTKTPFLSAVNRVKKLLAEVQKRETQSVLKKAQRTRSSKRNKNPEDVVQAAAEASMGRDDVEEIIIKGSGKAISKTLDLAIFFQERDEYQVTMSTSSVAAVDDLVVDEAYKHKKRKVDDGVEGGENGENENGADGADEGQRQSAGREDPLMDVPDSRIRWISVLEVYVSLR